MKKLTYISAAIIASLTACDSSDMPIQHPDGYDYITFAAQTEKLSTRANPYEDYKPTAHPATMGVFGYYDIDKYADLTTTQVAGMLTNPVFGNEAVTYNEAEATWETSTKKMWNSYIGAKTFDFFAYMPHSTEATLASTATGTYQLTMPFSMPATENIIFDSKQAPLICALPEHKQGTNAEGDEFTFERVVRINFDQTLTAYKLMFRLDQRMGSVRQFCIKSVNLMGKIATSGNISRTYHLTNNTWTADAIQWTNLQHQSFTDTGINIPNDASSTSSNDSLLVSTTDFVQWGPTFYVIPDKEFQPTIAVTYDIELTAEDGTPMVTRKDITSTIILNKSNFSNLATGKTAMVYPIRILIQPRYLYVLADDDAYTGHLLID